MLSSRGLAAFLVAVTSVRAGTSPFALNSEISLLINNDLMESGSPHSDSGVLLLDEMNFTDATKACAALGESLWGEKVSFSEIQPNLDYLAYDGRYSSRQRFWIAPDHQKKARTINSKGTIVSANAREQLPVLCTQTAPYSNMTYQDTTNQDLHVTVFSNNEYLTGFRDRLSFRFLGLRYAEQPKRWTYTELYEGSGAKVSALEYGDACLQAGGTGTEDCHFLNVWTPYLPRAHSKKSHKKSGLKPVMFWIHGGAFTGGMGSDTTFDGGNMAARGDVVVVAINYRLANLGFLALDDGETNGNYGLADQITALDWVRKNIQDFGGDPDRITIFGQSAGAGSVRALLASPKARGKFAGAIMQSNLGGLAYGTTYSKYYSIEEEMDVAGAAILEATNCTQAASRIDCLRAIPGDIIANLNAVARYLVVDGVYLVSDELDLKNREATANVPLMMGLMRDDGAAMIGYPSAGQSIETFVAAQGLPPSVLSTDSFPVPNGQNLTLNVFNTTSRIATDGIFRCIDQATAYAGVKNDIFPEIYFYEFNRSYQMLGWSPNSPVCEAPKTAEFPDGDPSQEYFKCHSGELFFVFGTVLRQDNPFRDENDLPFEQFVLDSWVSFARSGNPTPSHGFLAARHYTNTIEALKMAGTWKPFSQNEYPVRQFQWPNVMVPFVELEQCKALGLPLDYYL